jgi:septal ring factor EnvC (AmiA/AmiB activator)
MFELRQFNTSMLWTRRMELRAVAAQFAHIESLVGYIEAVMQEILQKWKENIVQWNNKVAALKELFQSTRHHVASLTADLNSFRRRTGSAD